MWLGGSKPGGWWSSSVEDLEPNSRCIADDVKKRMACFGVSNGCHRRAGLIGSRRIEEDSGRLRCVSKRSFRADFERSGAGST